MEVRHFLKIIEVLQWKAASGERPQSLGFVNLGKGALAVARKCQQAASQVLEKVKILFIPGLSVR